MFLFLWRTPFERNPARGEEARGFILETSVPKMGIPTSLVNSQTNYMIYDSNMVIIFWCIVWCMIIWHVARYELFAHARLMYICMYIIISTHVCRGFEYIVYTLPWVECSHWLVQQLVFQDDRWVINLLYDGDCPSCMKQALGVYWPKNGKPFMISVFFLANRMAWFMKMLKLVFFFGETHQISQLRWPSGGCIRRVITFFEHGASLGTAIEH